MLSVLSMLFMLISILLSNDDDDDDVNQVLDKYLLELICLFEKFYDATGRSRTTLSQEYNHVSYLRC